MKYQKMSLFPSKNIIKDIYLDDIISNNIFMFVLRSKKNLNHVSCLYIFKFVQKLFLFVKM